MEKYLKAINYYWEVANEYHESIGVTIEEAMETYSDEISGIVEVAKYDIVISTDDFRVLLRMAKEWRAGHYGTEQ